MPHAFPPGFSPIPAHVEQDVTYSLLWCGDERVRPDRRYAVRWCDCTVTLPDTPLSYGITGTWHLVFAVIAHQGCPSELNAGRDTILVDPEYFKPDAGTIAGMLRGDLPAVAMDGCPLPTVQDACDHGFVSWPLYLGLTTDQWRSAALHARIPKATAAP
jgi:hypothetical protein